MWNGEIASEWIGLSVVWTSSRPNISYLTILTWDELLLFSRKVPMLKVLEIFLFLTTGLPFKSIYRLKLLPYSGVLKRKVCLSAFTSRVSFTGGTIFLRSCLGCSIWLELLIIADFYIYNSTKLFLLTWLETYVFCIMKFLDSIYADDLGGYYNDYIVYILFLFVFFSLLLLTMSTFIDAFGENIIFNWFVLSPYQDSPVWSDSFYRLS